MPTVDIPDVGTVEFPDSMSPDEIRVASVRLHTQHAPPAAYMPDISDPNAISANWGLPGSVPISMNPKMEAGATAAALTMVGAPAIGGTAGAILRSPLGSGAAMGALEYAKTRSIPAALKEAVYGALLSKAGSAVVGGVARMVPSSLLARMTHGLAQAAATELPAAAEAVAPAAEEAVTAAYRGIPSLMNIGGSSAEEAAAVARAASQGASRMSALARPPVSIPIKAAAEDVARVGWAARAEDYAKWKAAGGVLTPAASPAMAAPIAAAAAPVAEAAAPAAASAVGDAGESLMQNRLRASVLLKQNPAALAEEVAAKVVSLKQGVGKGLSAAQVGSSLEDLYGFSKSVAKNMVDMIFQTHGLK